MQDQILQLFKKMGGEILPCMVHSKNLKAFEAEGWARTYAEAEKKTTKRTTRAKQNESE